MCIMKCFDVNEELLVQHYNHGIRLVKPDDKQFNQPNHTGLNKRLF
jgi:hypothetical protein